MTLSPLDDYPVHQVAQPIRYPATSDRNFYDRYYFNCHAGTDELMLIIGVGQYPNLGVTDAFALARHADTHRVVRASRELGDDRMDTSVGPFRVEVIEGLRRLRVVLEPNEHGLEFDLTWESVIPAQPEPRHFIRQQERVIFDSVRLAQTGRWSGYVRSGGEEFAVTPDRWQGSRDRSWGVRPVGEGEPPGIQVRNPAQFYWMYAPMQFDEFSILTIVQEDAAGTRVLEEAVRIWPESAGLSAAARQARVPAALRARHTGSGCCHDRVQPAGRRALRGESPSGPPRLAHGRDGIRTGARLEARHVPGTRARRSGGLL